LPSAPDDGKGKSPRPVLGCSSALNVFSFKGPVDDRLPLLAMFGAIYPGQEDLYRQDFWTQSPAIGLESELLWDDQYDNSLAGSALNMTAYGVSFTEVKGTPIDISFNVVVTNSVRGLCVYWNFRAVREASAVENVGRRTLLLPRCGPTAHRFYL